MYVWKKATKFHIVGLFRVGVDNRMCEGGFPVFWNFKLLWTFKIVGSKKLSEFSVSVSVIKCNGNIKYNVMGVKWVYEI